MNEDASNLNILNIGNATESTKVSKENEEEDWTVQSDAVRKLQVELRRLRRAYEALSRRTAALKVAVDLGTEEQDNRLEQRLRDEMKELESQATRLGTPVHRRTARLRGDENPMSLLGLTQEKQASTTRLQLLADSIRDTKSALLATKAGEVKEVVNPHCKPDPEVAQELNDAERLKGATQRVK